MSLTTTLSVRVAAAIVAGAVLDPGEPGTVPVRPCDWHRGNSTMFPPAFMEWAQATGAPIETGDSTPTLDGQAVSQGFRILSPLDGDVYHIPPGVDRRYSTVALRAYAGMGSGVRWFVDGHEQRSARWPLVPGTHRVEARSSRGELSRVTVRVE